MIWIPFDSHCRPMVMSPCPVENSPQLHQLRGELIAEVHARRARDPRKFQEAMRDAGAWRVAWQILEGTCMDLAREVAATCCFQICPSHFFRSFPCVLFPVKIFKGTCRQRGGCNNSIYGNSTCSVRNHQQAVRQGSAELVKLVTKVKQQGRVIRTLPNDMFLASPSGKICCIASSQQTKRNLICIGLVVDRWTPANGETKSGQSWSSNQVDIDSIL